MYWADHVGPKKIYETMTQLYDQHGDWLEPSSLLAELARDNRKFSDL
jgi:hypothetical protein